MKTTQENKGKRRLGREGEHPLGDLGQLILLAIFLAVWALDSFVFRFSTFPARAVPLAARLAAATLLLTGAVGFARKGHAVISEDTIRRGRLVTDGAFARVRHPLYLAALLFYAALAAATSSLISCALLAGIFGFYDVIASYEERALLRKYEDEYRAYRQRVPKWIPRLRGNSHSRGASSPPAPR